MNLSMLLSHLFFPQREKLTPAKQSNVDIVPGPKCDQSRLPWIREEVDAALRMI